LKACDKVNRFERKDMRVERMSFFVRISISFFPDFYINAAYLQGVGLQRNIIAFGQEACCGAKGCFYYYLIMDVMR